MRRIKSPMAEKKGSILTEATVFLPFFIIAAVTLVSLCRACWIDIMTVSTVEELLRKSSVSVLGTEYFHADTELEENGVYGGTLRIWKEEALTEGFEKVRFCYDTELHLPVAFVNRILLPNALPFCRWDGHSISGASLSFDEMQKDETGRTVCVFPRAGGKYHAPDCRYVRSSGVSRVLDRALMDQYSSCPLCTDGTEAEGTRVYIFPFGYSYHRQECSSVTRYVIEMDRQDAVCKGYTACSVCGGSYEQ